MGMTVQRILGITKERGPSSTRLSEHSRVLVGCKFNISKLW